MANKTSSAHSKTNNKVVTALRNLESRGRGKTIAQSGGVTHLCQLSGRAETDGQLERGCWLLLQSVKLSPAPSQKPCLAGSVFIES